MNNRDHTNSSLANKKCAVLIVTHNKVDQVIEIIDALEHRSNRTIIEFTFFVGVSSNAGNDYFKNRIIKRPSINYYRLKNDSFWANSFQQVFQKIIKYNFEYFIHVNDDFNAIHLYDLDLSKLLSKNTVSYANIFDESGVLLFGKRTVAPLGDWKFSPKFKVFNANFFSCEFPRLARKIPKYRFHHAFLDYVISYRLMEDCINEIPISVQTFEENEESRRSVRSTFSNYTNSRLNPADAFMLYWCINRPILGFIISGYCILKILSLKFKELKN